MRQDCSSGNFISPVTTSFKSVVANLITISGTAFIMRLMPQRIRSEFGQEL
jgi:hypothetical protein